MLIMKKLFLILIAFAIPTVSMAQSINIGPISIGIGSNRISTVSDLMWFFIDTLNSLIPIIIGLAVLLFIWGLFRYFSTDSQNTKKQAVRIIGYGIVSIFVMVSLWGIIFLISGVLGVGGNGGTIVNHTPINTATTATQKCRHTIRNEIHPIDCDLFNPWV